LAFSTKQASRSTRFLPSLLCWCLLIIVPCVGALLYRAAHTLPYSVTPRALDSRFVAEEVASFSYNRLKDWENGAYPICVAADEKDNVFISIQLKGQEEYAGRIAQLLEGDKVRFKTIAESPCLFHTFGLAARKGQLFVSRAGFLARAKNGHVEYENAGAITRLSDLDRDGLMDYYEDVVEGLPGSQGPTVQHSNNAITFGPDGSLYIAQGAHSDRDVLNHPWEGKILRVSPDFKRVTVFASGLRNPFGLVHGPEGQLFATDNDVSIGNPGDELNLIKEGAHYGHPYVVGDDDGGGSFVKPLLLWDKGSFAGMTYTESPALPEECRGCLFIADFGGNAILRVTLTRVGDTYSAKATPFAVVPEPIGIAVTSSGTFYITSYQGAVFRIRPASGG
jgi:sugar lactone lactonase YvrE